MALEFFEADGVIVKGQLQPVSLVVFRQAMRQFTEGEKVTIRVDRRRQKRSISQNKFWWSVVVKAFSDNCGEYPEDMHEILKLELNPKIIEWTDPDTGEVTERRIGRSTANLNTKEFTLLIEKAQELGARMGIYIPSSDE